MEGDKTIGVQWFQKEMGILRRDKKIKYCQTDAKDIISSDSIMHWLIGSERTSESFVLSKTDILHIDKLYVEHDSCYI